MSSWRQRAFQAGVKTLNLTVILSMLLSSGAGAPAAKAAQEQVPEPQPPAPEYGLSDYQPQVFTHPRTRYGTPPRQAAVDPLPVAINRVTASPPPALFIENSGQFDGQALFQVYGLDGMVHLTSDALWITLRDDSPVTGDMLETHDESPFAPTPEPGGGGDEGPIQGVNLKVTFVGANPDATIEGFDRLDVRASYFLGSDPEAWRMDVPVWGGVRYVNYYPGYDLEMTSQDGEWVWRLVEQVHAPQEPEPEATLGAAILKNRAKLKAENESDDLRLRIEGADALSLVNDGVRVRTGAGDLILPLPELVGSDLGIMAAPDGAEGSQAGVWLDGNEIVLPVPGPGEVETPAGTPTPEPTMTPTPTPSATPSPSAAPEETPTAPNTPTSPEAFLPAKSFPFGLQDLRFAALDTGLRRNRFSLATSHLQAPDDDRDLIFSTYLGGSSNFAPYSIAVDEAGSAYLVGPAYATEFPEYYGPFTGLAGADRDVAVYKFSLDGSYLSYLTILGGNGSDCVFDCVVEVDSNGAAYIFGGTQSSDFPTTDNAYDRLLDGTDAFLTKLSPSGTSLEYSTFLGGYGTEAAHGIAVESPEAVYLTGFTASTNFPTSVGAYSRIYRGSQDVFVTKMDTTGSGPASLVYSTYVGGTLAEQGHGIAVLDGVAYVTGQTNSSNFPTLNAYDGTANGGWDAFVLALNPAGSALIFSTYLGGSGTDCEQIGDFHECAIDVSPAGIVYVAGNTTSPDFPVYRAANKLLDGPSDGYLVGMTTSGAVKFATYFGGSGGEEIHDLAVDASGAILITGRTSSNDFPLSDNAFDRYGGSNDAFLIKASPDGLGLMYSTYLGGNQGAEIGFAVAAGPQGWAYLTGMTSSNDFPLSGNPFDATLDGQEDGFVTVLTLAAYDTAVLPVSPDAVMSDCLVNECWQGAAAGTQGTGGGPINTNTGGEFYQVSDLSIRSLAGTLSFERTYSSLAADLYTTGLGYGWTHSLETRLVFPGDPFGEPGFVLFKAHSANLYRYLIEEDGTYRPMPGVAGTLTRQADPAVTYTLAAPDQTIYTFDEDGRLIEWADADGRSWTYSHVDGLLDQIADESGERFLQFDYDEQGRIASVQDHTERGVSFDYNAAGDLATATDVTGGTWQYQYDSAHRLTRIIDPGGRTVERTEYDSQGRAVRQYDGEDRLVLTLVYNSDGTTTLIDALVHPGANG